MAPPQPPCEVCGNRTYNLIEGFFYCTQCHSQNQILREVETEQMGATLGAVIRVASQKKTTDGGGAEGKKKKSQFIEDGIDMGVIRHWTLTSADDYPCYLYQIGRRLTTFPRLVVQFASILHRDFDVPVEVKKISLYLVQKYFQYYGVAFTDAEVELEDEENQTIFRYQRTAEEIRKLQKVQASQNVQVRSVREKASQSQQQADIWNYLSQTREEQENTQAAQNLEIQEEIDQAEVNAVIEFATKLTPKATQLAARIYLEVDLVVAFAFIASQAAGATWISIWDIYRWYREGRLLVTNAQLHAICFAPDHTATFSKRHIRNRFVFNGTLPMSDYFRDIIYLSHILPLPPSMPITPFEQNAKRFIFNLNLPMVFLHRINALVSIIGTPMNNIGKEFVDALFPTERNFVNKVHDAATIGTATYFSHVFKNNRKMQCFLSMELKVIALIVIALKMMFGFDDQREYTMINKMEDEEIKHFNIHDWLIQLNLRLAVWRGTPINTVLSSQYLLHKYDNSQIRKRTNKVELGSMSIKRYHYDRCVPFRQYNYIKDKQFYEVFSDDISKIPIQHSSNEAFFAPLRFQATLNKHFRDDAIDDDAERFLDPEKEQLFFADYRDYGMNFEPNDTLQYDYTIYSCSHNSDSKENEEKWLTLFPCSKAYLKYPISTKMYIMKKDPTRFGYTPIMDYKKFSHIFEDSERYFSMQFSNLIDNLSYILGEYPEGIYATVLMIENMMLNTKNITKMKEALTNGKVIQAGFRFSTARRHDACDKFSYWIKESARDEGTQNFFYGRNKISSKIKGINELRNWENLDAPAMENTNESIGIDEWMTQNESINKEKIQVSTSETENDTDSSAKDNNAEDGEDDDVVFDIERNNEEENGDNDDGEARDEDYEVDTEISENEDEVEDEDIEDEGGIEIDAGEADNDDANSDTTLIDDVIEKDKNYGISSDLALTFLFWKYW